MIDNAQDWTVLRHFCLDSSREMIPVIQEALRLFHREDMTDVKPWIIPEVVPGGVSALFRSKLGEVKNGRVIYKPATHRLHTIIEVYVPQDGLMIIDSTSLHGRALFGEVRHDPASDTYVFMGITTHEVTGELLVLDEARVVFDDHNVPVVQYEAEVEAGGIYWLYITHTWGRHKVPYNFHVIPGTPEERHAREELEKAMEAQRQQVPVHANGVVTEVQDNFFASLLNRNGKSAH